MIKNVIFDVGNVLVDFCWEEVFHKLGFEGETFECVADATVRSVTWNEFDRGAKPDEEIIAACIKETPDYEREIRLFYDHVGETIRTYPYTVRWEYASLEKNGYHTYILSNFPKSTYEKATEELSFEKETTGAIFSYQVKCIKPEAEIYKLLLGQIPFSATGMCIHRRPSGKHRGGRKAWHYRHTVSESAQAKEGFWNLVSYPAVNK